MGIFNNLSMDINILISIVAGAEFLKRLDKNNKFKRLYAFYPILFGFIAGLLITKPLILVDYLKNSFVYSSVAVLAYNVIKKAVVGEEGLQVFKPSKRKSAPAPTNVPKNKPIAKKININK